MDSVRFGRALGTGARLAAKTLVTAVDAATAPNPQRPQPPQANTGTQAQPQPATSPSAVSQPVVSPSKATPVSSSRPHPAKPVATVRQTSQGLAHGGRQFGRAVWTPVVKLSGVLWLELTGVFFGLFALTAGIAAWKLRGSLHASPANLDSHNHLLLALGVTALFGYFCISSFVRAHRRSRRS